MSDPMIFPAMNAAQRTVDVAIQYAPAKGLDSSSASCASSKKQTS